MTQQDIIRLHPESVAFCFNKWGHPNIPVNPVSLQAMAVKYGEAFLQDLAEKIESESEAQSFTGVIIPPNIAKGVRQSAENYSKKVQGMMVNTPERSKIERIAGTIAEIAGTFFGSRNRVNNMEQQQQVQQQVQQRRNQTALIAGIAVVLVMVAALFFFNKKTTIK